MPKREVLTWKWRPMRPHVGEVLTWKRRPRRPHVGVLRQKAAILLGTLLVAVTAALAEGSVTITSVQPNTGSIAGGTRLHIQGWGFSRNTGGTGNIIKIGDKFVCDPIPLHCTKHQIACKTRSALLSTTEYYSRYNRWSGWTEYLPVSVEVDGQHSECRPASGQQCVFRFHQGWLHTPRIYSLLPRAVEDGALLRVNGRFHSNAFAFEVNPDVMFLRQPHQASGWLELLFGKRHNVWLGLNRRLVVGSDGRVDHGQQDYRHAPRQGHFTFHDRLR